MKTDDLIRAMALDTRPGARPPLRRALLWALPLSAALTLGLFFAITSLRDAITAPHILKAVLIKQAITLALAGAGIALAVRLCQPGRGAGALRLLLALPVAFLVTAIGWDLVSNGLNQASTRLFGENYWRCLLTIPLFALPSLVILMAVLARGAPVDPGRTGFLAGLGAAGLGASVYALHCTDDSPLFILAWYTLAALFVGLLGRWAGGRFLRW